MKTDLFNSLAGGSRPDSKNHHTGPSGGSPKLFHTSDLSGPKLSHLCWLPTRGDITLVLEN